MSFRRDAVLVILLIVLTALYILALPTRHFTSDAINRLEFTEGHNLFELWHSQHLLAQLPGYAAYLVLNNLRAYQAIQLIDALMSGITVAAIYAAARSLGAKGWIALLAGLAICFSYGFWHYATDPDVYSPVMMAVALLLLALIRYLNAPTNRRIVWLSLAAALAVLMHQMNVELAGLIGLALLTAHGWKVNVPVRHVIIYGGLIVVIVVIAYGIGWQSATAYSQQALGVSYSFLGYVERYFNMASAGQATWGKSLHLDTIPQVGYAILKSWTLPPLRSRLTLIDAVLVGGLMASAVFWFLYGLAALRKFAPAARLIALISIGTLIANVISAWWWQAGNIKFYLPMQSIVIVLAVVYVVNADAARPILRRLAYLAVSVSLICLVILHIKNTLTYETQGGVFVVAAEMEAYHGSGTPTAQFADVTQMRILPLISPYQSSALPADFCTESLTQPIWLVVRDVLQGACPTLDSQVHTEDYQADTSRQMWKIYAPKR